MHSKTTDEPQARSRAVERAGLPAPSFPDTVAYWLENEHGTRVTRLYRVADRPMRLAGRALEHLDHLTGWTLIRRDTNGARHVVAANAALAELARPFMPERTPEEAAALASHFEALRAIPGPPEPDPEINDERVY